MRSPARSLAGGLFASALIAATAPAGGTLAPIRFQDISSVSGGPVDFGPVTSSVEKATGAFFDADGDGWDDLVVLSGAGEPFPYFLNRPDGAGGRTFVPAPPGNGLDSGAPLERDGACVTAADVDGDGDVDLYVGCGWNPLLASGENILLLNDGTGRFADATAAARLLDGDNTTAACAFLDMDLDGDLDLLSCNTDFPEAGKFGDGRAHLFRNLLHETGLLRFVDVTDAWGLTEDGKAVWSAIAPDVDGDGDPDIVLTHDIRGDTQLFLNDGTGRFTDASAGAGAGPGDDGTPSTFGDDTPFGMGLDAADVDNDGDLDLYVTDIDKNDLYINGGDGTFRERGATAGVRAGSVTWGCSFADFDLDGWIDLYVAGGDTYLANLGTVRPWLFRNLGNGTFADVTDGAGFRRDPPRDREDGTATADFDGDGRTDLLVVRAERDGASPYLYRNESPSVGRRWITVRFRGDGVASNTSAVGARVRVVPLDAAGVPVPGLAQLREVRAAVGRGACSSLAQTFGLGCDAGSADVEVTWPRAGGIAGRTDLHLGLPLDGTIELRDDLGPYRRLGPAPEARVAGGRSTEIPLAGGEGPGEPPVVEVESGPAWATLSQGSDGTWSILVSPPAADVEAVFTVGLLARDPGTPGAASRQVLRVRAVPVPRVVEADARRHGRALRVRGRAFRGAEGTVLVDGVPAARVRLRREEGGETRLGVRLPRGEALGPGAHSVALRDDETGFTSDPFAFEVP